MGLDREAHIHHRQAHGRADILLRVHRRYREIAALDARTVAEVAALVHLLGVPEASSESILTKLPLMSAPQRTSSRMKNSASGPKYAVSATPVLLRVGLGTLGERARAALVALHGGGLDDVAAQVEGRSSKNGSMTAVAASGIRIMSDSWMPFQPAIEEPSNILPSSKVLSHQACWPERRRAALCPWYR